MTKTKEQIWQERIYFNYHPEIDYERLAILVAIFGWLIIFLLAALHLLGFIL